MMSAHAYNYVPLTRPSSRRQPLSNAFSNAIQIPAPEKIKAAPIEVQIKPPPSPPLPRQNIKSTPPTPPKLICDKAGTFQFHRIGFLGEGGFARVYEVKDSRGSRLACKVITKDSLKTKKAKTKLYAEIKIHRSLAHPNIVLFRDCFEDDANVYMTLELCPSGSLMDMLRNRHRFTEPESRFFMVQLIGACHYMHTHQVIHRDLKLGNLFLDRDMNIKVGDFGLAALIEREGERKKTICGTPNYIAPEVLFDTVNGHSFEVDTWSIGVILYTLVVGRPPFQTKEVKTIYKRIRDNQYDFPSERHPSPQSQLLIQQILTPVPDARPTLHSIVANPWFTHGIVPASIPVTAHDSAPDFRHVTRAASEANLAALRKRAGLDGEVRGIAVPDMRPGDASARPASTSIAQQEKEFQRAVQPGSPISALLTSARQPLVVSGAGGVGAKPRENLLLRKLTAAAREKHEGLENIAEEGAASAGPSKERAIRERGAEASKKQLESQKARIVAQMVPVHNEGEEQENVPPSRRERVKTKEQEKVAKLPKGKEREKERVPEREREIPQDASPSIASTNPVVKPNAFDAAFLTLAAAFDARALGKVFPEPGSEVGLPDERVFIVSWVDYCNKYGMGYALTDGSVGVHFNDSTSVVLSPNKSNFDYITSRRAGTVYVRKSYTVAAYPEDIKTKVSLVKHFEKYIMDRLYGDYEWCFEDLERTRGMNFVQKYLRMKHVIVFKLSHDCLQFNFYDHTKIILSSSGMMITHIDKNYALTRWPLSQVMALSLPTSASGSSSSASEKEHEEARFQQKLLDKLRYCKEVLGGIKTASGEEMAGLNLKRTASQATIR